jgi:pyridoxal phosphate enzyme (YggS family)
LTSPPIGEAYAILAEACAAGEATLIAVVKRQPIERILAAYDLGVRHFAHSHLQEATAIRTEIGVRMPQAHWHFIGRIQSNKCAGLKSGWLRLHAIDRHKIARRCGDAEVLLQVRLGGEHSKGGVDPSGLRPLLDAIRSDTAVRVRGLMALPPPVDGWNGVDYFSQLARLRDALLGEGLLPTDAGELSMGTSADWPAALDAGATWIRVGHALMGQRLQ